MTQRIAIDRPEAVVSTTCWLGKEGGQAGAYLEHRRPLYHNVDKSHELESHLCIQLHHGEVAEDLPRLRAADRSRQQTVVGLKHQCRYHLVRSLSRNVVPLRLYLLNESCLLIRCLR